MTDKSRIEWTDATWNPVTGCSKVSPGCAHCYAEAISLRFGRSAGPWTPQNAAENVVLHPERIEQPLRWRRPRMVFVNSMSDLFHEQVSDQYIAEVFGVMGACPEHTFQVLTKRPERMRDLLSEVRFRSLVLQYEARYGDARRLTLEPAPTMPYPNVWLGTSIENRRFVHRADALRATPAAVRFISAEPLLGPLVATGGEVDYHDPDYDGYAGPSVPFYSHWPDGTDTLDVPELTLNGIDWLIVGGESGRGHRPMRWEWARDLRDAAEVAGTAFFMKQAGGARPGGDLDALPEGLRVREWPRVMSART